MVEGLVLFESIYIFVENMLNLNQQRTMARKRGRKWEEKKKKRPLDADQLAVIQRHIHS